MAPPAVCCCGGVRRWCPPALRPVRPHRRHHEVKRRLLRRRQAAAVQLPRSGACIGAPHGAWSWRPAGIARRILPPAAASQLTARRRALSVAPCPGTKHLLRTGSDGEARPSGRKPVESGLAAEVKQRWAETKQQRELQPGLVGRKGTSL
ncbi:unnamed protein product [Urochloa humidicola]